MNPTSMSQEIKQMIDGVNEAFTPNKVIKQNTHFVNHLVRDINKKFNEANLSGSLHHSETDLKSVSINYSPQDFLAGQLLYNSFKNWKNYINEIEKSLKNFYIKQGWSDCRIKYIPRGEDDGPNRPGAPEHFRITLYY